MFQSNCDNKCNIPAPAGACIHTQLPNYEERETSWTKKYYKIIIFKLNNIRNMEEILHNYVEFKKLKNRRKI